MQEKLTLSLTDDELVRKIHEYIPHMRGLSEVFRDACIAEIERIDRLHALRRMAQGYAESFVLDFIEEENLSPSDKELLKDVLPGAVETTCKGWSSIAEEREQ